MEPADEHVPEVDSSSSAHPDATDASTDARNTCEETANAASVDPADLLKELAVRRAEYLRLKADFDNYIKRTQRDSEQQAAAQKEAFIRDLLPILDDLERALASVQCPSSEPLHEGVTMTLRQMGRLLSGHGVEAAEDLGRPFDPHRHEAVAVRCDPHRPDEIVLEVIQRGYLQQDKVIRPARVIVNDLNHFPGDPSGR